MDYEKQTLNILNFLSKGKIDIASQLFLDFYECNIEKLTAKIEENSNLLDLVIFNIDKISLSILPIKYKNDDSFFDLIIKSPNFEKNYIKLTYFDDCLIVKNREVLLKKVDSWHKLGVFPCLYQNLDFMQSLFKKGKTTFNISYFNSEIIENLPEDIIKLVFDNCPSDDLGRINFFNKIPINKKKILEVQSAFLDSLPSDMDVFPQFKDLYKDIKYPCLVENIKKVVEKPIEERKSLEGNIPKTNKSKKTKI